MVPDLVRCILMLTSNKGQWSTTADHSILFQERVSGSLKTRLGLENVLKSQPVPLVSSKSMTKLKPNDIIDKFGSTVSSCWCKIVYHTCHAVYENEYHSNDLPIVAKK